MRILETPRKECEGCFCAWGHTIENLEMSQNRTYSFSESDEKNNFSQFGHFISNIKKWGISRKNHVINFKTRKKRKWAWSILGHFKIFEHMPSRAKNPFLGHFKEPPVNIYISLAFDKAPDILKRYDEHRFQAIQPEIEERRKSSFFRITARSSAWTTRNTQL